MLKSINVYGRKCTNLCLKNGDVFSRCLHHYISITVHFRLACRFLHKGNSGITAYHSISSISTYVKPKQCLLIFVNACGRVYRFLSIIYPHLSDDFWSTFTTVYLLSIPIWAMTLVHISVKCNGEFSIVSQICGLDEAEFVFV